MYKYFVLILLVLSGCTSSLLPPQRGPISNYFFEPTEGVEKHFFLGRATFVETIDITPSEYKETDCSKTESCTALATWHIYDMQGHFLYDNTEAHIRVAQRGNQINTQRPWIAVLEDRQNPQDETELDERGLGVDYILVGLAQNENRD